MSLIEKYYNFFLETNVEDSKVNVLSRLQMLNSYFTV